MNHVRNGKRVLFGLRLCRLYLPPLSVTPLSALTLPVLLPLPQVDSILFFTRISSLLPLPPHVL